MSTSKRKIKKAVQQADLGDHKGDNAKLAEKLDKIAEKVNADSNGTWPAIEWLRLAVQPFTWTASKLKKGAIWAFRRLSSYNERMANADKTRKEGKAILVKAEAEAEDKKAGAQIKRAKARALEIENEKAEELLRQLKARGIDLAAEVKDGKLHVAVVKTD